MPPNPQETVIQAGAGPISGAGSASGVDEPRRSRKPANTKFKQQQLPAWQPMLTARSVLPFLVAIGVAFIPIGIALYLSASNVTELPIHYTDCTQLMDSDKPQSFGSGPPCYNVTVNDGDPPCRCRVPVFVERDILGPVFVYYALDNFFQNHRKYVKSRDDQQLMGDFKPAGEGIPSADCYPFQKLDGTQGFAPCGAIANSLFNDSIRLKYHGGSESKADAVDVVLLKKDIAWKTDKAVKFRNPEKATSADTLKQVCNENKLVKPKYWRKNLWELDTDDFSNNGLQNEDLIVWMRTAAFPSFRKLYRRVNHTTDFKDSLPAGNYTVEIDYNYPVKTFDGKKYVIISSVSWIGGRNPFLGIAYMTVGCACLLLAAVFFFIHVKWGKNYEEAAFAGLTINRPFNRVVLREVFNTDRMAVAGSGSRSPLSTHRWLDTIPSASEPVSSSAGSSRPATGGTTRHFSGGNTRDQSVHFGLDSLCGDDSVKVQVVSGGSVGGLRTGQTMHELLNDMLAKVTVVDADDQLLDVSTMRASPRKSILRPEELTDLELRVRRRQMMTDQPVLVD